MNQKVKLQVSADLEDVSNLCANTLEEAVLNVEKLHSRISKAKQTLTETPWNDLDSLNEVLDIFDSCRTILSKIDTRLGDSSSIIYGLIDILSQKNPESKEEVKDDNLVTG